MKIFCCCKNALNVVNILVGNLLGSDSLYGIQNFISTSLFYFFFEFEEMGKELIIYLKMQKKNTNNMSGFFHS